MTFGLHEKISLENQSIYPRPKVYKLILAAPGSFAEFDLVLCSPECRQAGPGEGVNEGPMQIWVKHGYPFPMGSWKTMKII
jgi:hypothetical protein